MVYPVTLPTGLAKDVEALARRQGKQPKDIIQRAVRDFVRQEISDDSDRARAQRLHTRIKSRLRKSNPALERPLSRRALVKRMERLSVKAANGLPFTTWQQAQSFIRGEDHYDFVRQQYISH